MLPRIRWEDCTAEPANSTSSSPAPLCGIYATCPRRPCHPIAREEKQMSSRVERDLPLRKRNRRSTLFIFKPPLPPPPFLLSERAVVPDKHQDSRHHVDVSTNFRYERPFHPHTRFFHNHIVHTTHPTTSLLRMWCSAEREDLCPRQSCLSIWANGIQPASLLFVF